MYETSDELATMQLLLDSSHAGACEHLRGIIHDGRTLAAATVTRAGEPRVSALDGYFLHGRWTISTSATSPKGRHLRARPAISVGAHVSRRRLVHKSASVCDHRGAFLHKRPSPLRGWPLR